MASGAVYRFGSQTQRTRAGRCSKALRTRRCRNPVVGLTDRCHLHPRKRGEVVLVFAAAASRRGAEKPRNAKGRGRGQTAEMLADASSAGTDDELLRIVHSYLQRFGPTDRLWQQTAEAVTRVARAETPEQAQQARAQLVRAGETLTSHNSP